MSIETGKNFETFGICLENIRRFDTADVLGTLGEVGILEERSRKTVKVMANPDFSRLVLRVGRANLENQLEVRFGDHGELLINGRPVDEGKSLKEVMVTRMEEIVKLPLRDNRDPLIHAFTL